MAKEYYQCGICKEEVIFDLERSLKAHLGKKHRLVQPYADKVVLITSTLPTKKAAYKPKHRKRKEKKQIITPEMTYIDIPVIIRVPIVIGKVSVLNVK